MRTKTKATVGLATAGALALALSVTIPAYADYQPGPSDVVGVGGDTPQYALQFLTDGSATAVDGYNTAGNSYKVVNFNATADANGRAAYAQGSTETSPALLNPTDVLRAGTTPIQRTQSSGDAIKALLADTGSTETINYVASASQPTAAQQTAAANAGWGFLHVVQFATDSVQVAAASTTNAPAGLSAAELLGIYTGTYKHWNDLPGNSSGSTDAIIPELPASTSSVYKTFIGALTTANGGSTPTLATSVVTVEQNDPSAVTGAATPADAIVPFTAGRLNLWNSSYFHNPATVFPGGTALSAGIKLLSGTTPDAAAAYSSTIKYYVIFRNSDASDAAWQPGGTKNWVNTLFVGSSPFIKSGSGQADIAAAGLTYSYSDLGNVSSG
ncbi:MAG TPA: substrate-binding domain-containing protein [Mycobacteriales bacterium]|nr:substrate-binding domain-containing protein [Mycobacteriales bacterium]